MLFMSTLERLRNVEELLLDADTPPRKRLLDAGRTFWSVVRRNAQWPLVLRDAADRIRAPLVARGGIARSVQAMADECVEETAGELLRFARSAAWLLRNPAVGVSAYRAEGVVPRPIGPGPLGRHSRVNEQRRMRKKLAEAQCKLVQSERLALIGEAIAAISHEARNELSGLSTGLALLPMILDDRDTVVEVIGHLRASEGRLHRLFEDVRSFAAPVQLQRAICDVNDLWRRAWSSLKPAWEKRDVSFGEELNGMPLELMGDAFRLEQVFRNLFENSLAACADPVAISISCSEAMGKKGWISLAVRDNGPGLNTEQKQKVFDAFFTTKASGTGLGMAIAKRIVEAHGGTITVGEEAIHGAEFVLALPMADGCLTPAE